MQRKKVTTIDSLSVALQRRYQHVYQLGPFYSYRIFNETLHTVTWQTKLPWKSPLPIDVQTEWSNFSVGTVVGIVVT